MNWEHAFAPRAARMQRSVVRDLLRLTARPDMISFAGGLPAPELFPLDEFRRAAAQVLRDRGPEALQYGETEGVGELRDWIADAFSRPALRLARANVLITSGSQQALDLIGRVLLDAGDAVAVESPTYLAALAAWRPLGVKFLCAPSDADGMRVEALDSLDRERPKLVYVVPNFQNPQGTTLSQERRARLAAWLRERSVPCVEDNPYGELRYEGEPLPHLFALNATMTPGGALAGNVIHTGTFSKVLAPGLRVGWVVAPEPVIEVLTRAKQAADLQTSTLNQFLALELVRGGVLERQLPVLRAACAGGG